jgi:hypothetical protein
VGGHGPLSPTHSSTGVSSKIVDHCGDHHAAIWSSRGHDHPLRATISAQSCASYSRSHLPVTLLGNRSFDALPSDVGVTPTCQWWCSASEGTRSPCCRCLSAGTICKGSVLARQRQPYEPSSPLWSVIFGWPPFINASIYL